MIIYRELSSLEADLRFKAKTLYAISNNISAHYKKVKIRKKHGGTRTLYIPDEILKKVQRRINKIILSLFPVSPYATAYVYGGGIKKNALPHLNKSQILKLDIYKFFDSVTYSDIKSKVFNSKMFSEQNRILLTNLCFTNDALPQGAPTSPTISNILLYDFDVAVGTWCKERKITYTRYCDDMTFSGSFNVNETVNFVREKLKENGFLLKKEKTLTANQSHRQSVTGVIVNSELNVPIEYRKKLRQELYYCKKFGIESHLEHIGSDFSRGKFINHMLGKIRYVLYINPTDEKMKEYKDWLINEKQN